MNSMAPHTKHLAETALGGPVLPTVSAQQQTTGSQQQQRAPVNNSTPAMAPATISGSTPGDLGALPASAALNTTKHTLLGRAASTIKASRNKRSNSTTNKRNLFEDDKTTEGSGSQVPRLFIHTRDSEGMCMFTERKVLQSHKRDP